MGVGEFLVVKRESAIELSYRKQATELVARIECGGAPRVLRGGGRGWYEVATIPWRYDWHLRVICSVTLSGPRYGYGRPVPHEVSGRPSVKRYRADDEDVVRLLVEGETVEITFPIPDCIRPFHRTSGWGYAAGGPILLHEARYHCQVRVEARHPHAMADLRRTATGIEFIELRSGQAITIDSLRDQQTPPIWPEG